MKKRWIWRSCVLGTVALFIGLLFYVQKGIFFHPWHDGESYSSLCEDPDFRELRIPYKDGVLHGWLRRNSEEKKAPLLLFYGGNGQNSSNAMQLFEATNAFTYFEGHHVLFVDYPGYGLSDGSPSEESLFSAALAVFDYAVELEEVDPARVTVLGYSIGTGVATYVAYQRRTNGLILVAPYDRALSLYNETLNIFHGPLKLLARYSFDSLSYAKEIRVSPLIISSRSDEVIPYELSLKLAKAFPTPVEPLLLDGILHDRYFFHKQVLESIQQYLHQRAA